MSQAIKPAPIRKSFTVRATPEKAFKVFTEGMGRWWPGTHHIGKAELERIVIEPRIGGRWYEVCVDGSQCQWGDVLAWDPPRRLTLAWRLNAQFEYDPGLTTEVEVRFEAAGEGATRVLFEHRGLERLGAEVGSTVAAMDEGWGQILDHYVAEAAR